MGRFWEGEQHVNDTRFSFLVSDEYGGALWHWAGFSFNCPAVAALDEGVSYYYAGATRLAMRTGGQAAVYFVTDHLGSVNQLVDPYGAPLAGERQLYMPWGEKRLSTSISLTRVGYTGQYDQAEIGLMFYQARWYDAGIIQFNQPDTLIPDPYNTLDWNRYGYARYNPLKYTDPTGHIPVGDICGHSKSDRNLLRFQNLELKDNVERTLQNYARQVANALANMLNRVNRYMYYSGETASLSKYTPDAAFDFVFGGPLIVEGDASIDSAARAAQNNFKGDNWIKVNPHSLGFISNHPRIIVHEIGHVFNNVMGKGLEAQIPQSQVREDGNYSGPNNDYYGYAGGQWDWQFSLPGMLHQKNEIFAENFLGWTFDQWNVTSSGSAKASFMNYLMFTYLSYMGQ